MAKNNITQFDATDANNTDIKGIDISEGMSPANVNNALRALMATLKDMDTGATSLTSPSGTNITATTALKTPAIQFTDGDAAITIADGGGVTANNFSSTSVNIDGGAVDGVTLGTNSAVTQAVIDNINIDGSTIGHTSDTDLLTITSGLLTVAGEVSMTTLDIGGTNVTATATELNILDGVTASTSELNILDGVTATTSELNIMDGVTATASEINIIDGDTSATSTTVADADRVVYNDAGTMKQVAVTDLDTYVSGTTKTLTNKTLTSPVINTSVSGSAILDEDDFASNSDTKLATQQSIKAYIDTSENAAATSATNAANSATSSATSATLSQNYANKVDGAVEGSNYSSKAWAIGGTGVNDTAGAGAAKNWATEADTVDGTEHSSKTYAISGSTLNSGSAKNWAIGGGDSFTTSTTIGNTGLYSAKYYAELAASSVDNFDDTYLGAKSSDPTVDNDGDALTAGDLYFNTTNDILRVYNGSSWQDAATDTSTLASQGFAVAMAIAL